jgi:hypothetical protein
MARKGTDAKDYRSEAERVGPRSDEPSLTRDPAPGTRSSDRIMEEIIRTRLSIEPELATSEVTVEVRGNNVALTGSADTINSKQRIEELVKRIDGVQKVDNNLSIRVGESLEEFSRSADAARLREEEARRLREKR